MKHISIDKWVLFFCFLLCGGMNASALGVLDSGFGSNGTVSAGFGKGTDYIQMTGICADGSLIGLGTAGAGQGRIFTLAKFTPQGTLDATFGQGGLAVVTQPGLPYYLANSPVALAVTPDCSAYVAGGFGPDMSVGKYDPNGALVQIFDGGATAFLTNGIPQALAVQNDGSVLVAGVQGNEYGKYTVYRYLASGALDINFGSGGKSYYKMGWKGKPTSIRPESGGKIVVTGWVTPENVITWYQGQSLLARYNFDGSLDSSFGEAGVVINPVRTKLTEIYQTSFTLPDGRIMAAGINYDPADDHGTANYLFSRFMPNGLPDKTFGVRGGTLISSLDPNESAHYPTYQNDGSIFLSNGNAAVYKFGPSGHPDPSFGDQRTPGKVTLTYMHAFIAALATAPDGKLFVGGGYFRGTPPGTSGATYDYDYMAVRLNGGGTVDDSFGTGGIVTRDAGDCPANITSVALQPDGKIVIGGGRTSGSSTLFGTGISRYNANGTVDVSFGDNGKLFLYDQNSIFTLISIKVQPDGKILAAGGMGGVGSVSDAVRVMRFNENGALDTSFGAGGVFTYYTSSLWIDLSDMALQPDGKIILGARTYNDFALLRINADGTLDPTLGGTGVVTTDINLYDNADAMALQPDGKILQGGSCGNAQNYDFCMVRYNADGTLDQTFGRHGKALTDLGGSQDYLRSIALSSDGSIVAVGARNNIPNSSLAVIKYYGNGTPDYTFAGGGIYNALPASSYFGNQASVQVLNDDSIMVVSGMLNNIGLLKLTPSGALDTSWAPSGMLDTGIYNRGYYGPHSLLDGQGRIVVAGTSDALSGFIARFSSDK